MKIDIKILLFVLIASLFSCKGTTQESGIEKPIAEFGPSEMEKNGFPKSVGIVNDYGQIFSETQYLELTKVLYEYDSTTTRQIAVITIDSIAPYKNIEKYASDLGNEWGVGAADKNNGLVIVICKPCRQIAIATGLGTEQVLTDEICNEVIAETILPEFKNGEFYTGITKGVNELIRRWN
ncbi:TPM domain-containing protein [Cellulophaga baltica 4]|nr:TPM domain-containing protein [Cellulophaga baltica 4]